MSAVRFERRGPVGLIALARAERRNALTPEMLGELVRLADQAEVGVRAIALVGDGPAFCAGFDLRLCEGDPEGGVLRRLLTGLSYAILALRRFRGPVVMGAHGAAIAGGCALLGGADFVVTDPEAKIGYPVLPLGISPAVSAPFLSAAVGEGRARERLLEPTLVSGREAVRLGLAHELAERGQVVERTIALAGELASKPAGGLEATKAWMNELDRAGAGSGAALRASLELTGGSEERQLLPRVWSRRTESPKAE